MDDCPQEYLEFNDIEDESLKAYNTDTKKHVKLKTGELVDYYDKQFKVKGKHPFEIKHIVPEGLEIVNIPMNQMYKTFEEYMYEYEGHKERDPEKHRYGYWENPQTKWDWYQIGGRWTGFFRLKRIALLPEEKITFDELGFSSSEFMNFVEMYLDDKEKFEHIAVKFDTKTTLLLMKNITSFIKRILPEHKIGEPGLMTEYAQLGYADQARKKDIDFDFMRKMAEEKAIKDWDEVNAVIGDAFSTFKSWSFLRDVEYPNDIEKARVIYHEQEAVKKLKTIKKHKFWTNAEDFNIPKDVYIQNARDKSTVTFAIIKDGKWYEKGDMGWWGFVSDEKNQSDWNREFNKLLDACPDDTLLTVVDCHI